MLIDIDHRDTDGDNIDHDMIHLVSLNPTSRDQGWQSVSYIVCPAGLLPAGSREFHSNGRVRVQLCTAVPNRKQSQPSLVVESCHCIRQQVHYWIRSRFILMVQHPNHNPLSAVALLVFAKCWL